MAGIGGQLYIYNSDGSNLYYQESNYGFSSSTTLGEMLAVCAPSVENVTLTIGGEALSNSLDMMAVYDMSEQQGMVTLYEAMLKPMKRYSGVGTVKNLSTAPSLWTYEQIIGANINDAVTELNSHYSDYYSYLNTNGHLYLYKGSTLLVGDSYQGGYNYTKGVYDTEPGKGYKDDVYYIKVGNEQFTIQGRG